MTRPARHLALVDQATGEIVDSRELGELQEALTKAKADLKNAERDLRGKRATIARMEADKVRERMEHPERDLIVRVCRYWWRKIHNENARMNPLTPDRFDAVARLVELEELVKEEVPGRKRPKKRRQWLFQMEHFKAAIDGAAHEPYSNTLRSGKVELYNDLTTIFKSADSLGRHIGRCPYELVPILPARPEPGALDLRTVTRDTPVQVPSHAAGPAAQHVGGSYAVGSAFGRVALRLEEGGLLVRCGLVVGPAREPA